MKLKAVRGTKDIFGDDAVKYDYIVETAKKIFTSYGYSRIITPIFEDRITSYNVCYTKLLRVKEHDCFLRGFI